MKAVILAGGLGTRLSEVTDLRPKPMVEIGGRPILWHIMKVYSAHGIHEFIICLGYKGHIIKEYFSNYLLHMSDVTFDMAESRTIVHHRSVEPWRITLVDTGEHTMTGGRLKRVRAYLPENEPFCMTYGDGVSDVDITASLAFHRSHGRLATMTVVRPPGRFGAVEMEGDVVTTFQEKPTGDGAWINGGFFVLSKQVVDFIQDDSVPWEQAPLKTLAAERQLLVWKHHGYWQCMDTMREKQLLESQWASGTAPWKIWD
jgi:glucose-1-phosphate cytidylyltransferase